MKSYHLLILRYTTALCAPVYFIAQMNDCLLKSDMLFKQLHSGTYKEQFGQPLSRKALSKQVSVHANETSLPKDHFYFCT